MSQSEWDNAPFNEQEIPEQKFEVEVTVTLSRKDVIETNNYNPVYDEECGWYADTSDTNWIEEYKQSNLKITDLLAELKKYVKADMENTSPKSGKGKYLEALLSACDGWKVEDMDCWL
jgi:hypothetical protein